MKIQNGIAYPDGTDQTANFRHKTITGENGETLYFAPVRVRTEADLRTFLVDKTARWTLPFGKSSDKIKVLYFVTPNEEMAEDFWVKINTEHSVCSYCTYIMSNMDITSYVLGSFPLIYIESRGC